MWLFDVLAYTLNELRVVKIRNSQLFRIFAKSLNEIPLCKSYR